MLDSNIINIVNTLLFFKITEIIFISNHLIVTVILKSLLECLPYLLKYKASNPFTTYHLKKGRERNVWLSMRNRNNWWKLFIKMLILKNWLYLKITQATLFLTLFSLLWSIIHSLSKSAIRIENFVLTIH